MLINRKEYIGTFPKLLNKNMLVQIVYNFDAARRIAQRIVQRDGHSPAEKGAIGL